MMSKSVSLHPLLYLSQVFSDQLCCDLLIKNSEKTFQAHKLVVASSSSYLRSLLVSADHDSQEMTVLLMPGTSSQTIRNFLSISYGLLQDNMDCFLKMNTDLLISESSASWRINQELMWNFMRLLRILESLYLILNLMKEMNL